jgi:alcohol dehydrogenase class IV
VPRLHVLPGGLAACGEVVAGLGIRRALVVTDAGVRAAGWADRVAAAARSVGVQVTVWDQARPDPADELVHRCRDAVLRHGCDGLVAVGGGSVIDVAKATAGLVAAGGPLLPAYEGLGRLAAAGPPVVAVPTTPCSGAEVSRHAVLAAAGGGRKYAVSGPHLAPRAVVVDPDTFATAPRDVLVDTVLDALVHAVEAYLARAATPYSDLFARAAVAAITRAAIPALATGAFLARPAGGPIASSDDQSALSERENVALSRIERGDVTFSQVGAGAGSGRAAVTELVTGCLLAGVAMAEANAGVIHALGYPLTSEYGIAHGRANALVAGAALRALASAAPRRCGELAALWSSPGQPPAAAPRTAAAEPHADGVTGRPEAGACGDAAAVGAGGMAGAGALAAAFDELGRRLGMAGSLAGYGVLRDRLPALARLACDYQPVLRNSPLDATEADLARIYDEAWCAGAGAQAAGEAGS